MESPNPVSAELEALKNDFSLWRASKPKQNWGRRIPDFEIAHQQPIFGGIYTM